MDRCTGFGGSDPLLRQAPACDRMRPTTQRVALEVDLAHVARAHPPQDTGRTALLPCCTPTPSIIGYPSTWRQSQPFLTPHTTPGLQKRSPGACLAACGHAAILEVVHAVPV